MGKTFDKQTPASVDTLTPASVDTLTPASLDTLTPASVYNTSDTLTPASQDNTSDTLTPASVGRENQGAWEVEYSDVGEADLHGKWFSCDKNPGHKNFIPVDKFSIEDLPADYRHNDVVDYIRAVAELTVRVKVKNVSRRITVGTGRVYNVLMSNSSRDGPCKCSECQNSSTPVMDYAYILMQTASHVASEYHDGDHTTSHLFFDRGDKPDTCSGAVTLSGILMMGRNNICDVCDIVHFTHDLKLARRLKRAIKRESNLQEICQELFPWISEYNLWREDPDRRPLLFIVSHPHGCSKQVSLGRWTNAHMLNSATTSVLYNTATCPGSSGALVSALPPLGPVPLLDGSLSYFYGVHHGIADLEKHLNFCY